jgi:hypothetical protein
MELPALANLVSVISGVLGGASLLFQVLPFLQAKGEYEALRAALRSARFPKDEVTQSVYGNESDWRELVAWLDRGNLLMVPLRRRVIRRTIIAVCTMTILVLSIPFDAQTVDGVRSSGDPIEWFDFLTMAVVAIGPQFAFFKRWLLSDTEKKFMENFRDLEDAFYRREVAPRLDVFNSVFQRLFSHTQGSARDEVSVLTQRLDDLARQVGAVRQVQEILVQQRQAAFVLAQDVSTGLRTEAPPEP